jgi:hypothetical protein
MFGSSLPLVVYWRVYVLLTLFIFVCFCDLLVFILYRLHNSFFLSRFHWKRCMYMYIIVSTYIYFECYWSGDLCIPVVRIAWKVLALSWKLRLSSGAKFYTMFMLASTGPWRVSTSCSTSSTRGVDPVTKSEISHEWEK